MTEVEFWYLILPLCPAKALLFVLGQTLQKPHWGRVGWSAFCITMVSDEKLRKISRDVV